jgi:hypothetical protein
MSLKKDQATHLRDFFFSATLTVQMLALGKQSMVLTQVMTLEASPATRRSK